MSDLVRGDRICHTGDINRTGIFLGMDDGWAVVSWDDGSVTNIPPIAIEKIDGIPKVIIKCLTEECENNKKGFCTVEKVVLTGMHSYNCALAKKVK